MDNGQKKARQSFDRFSLWVAEREFHGDYLDYIRRGKLNRSEVAKELDVGRSAFQQNPAIKNLAEELDHRWGFKKPTQPKSAAEEGAARERANEKVKRTEASNSKLLETIAMLEQENRQLRLQLDEMKQFKTAREAFLATMKDFH